MDTATLLHRKPVLHPLTAAVKSLHGNRKQSSLVPNDFSTLLKPNAPDITAGFDPRRFFILTSIPENYASFSASFILHFFEKYILPHTFCPMYPMP